MASLSLIEHEIDSQNRALADAYRAMSELEARCLTLALAPFESLVESFDALDFAALRATSRTLRATGLRG